uniref:Uncharacterized protein n=1 Tax=Triticum urartu TaxID=4572 RepID=A0A8R7QAF5_TRIUA
MSQSSSSARRLWTPPPPLPLILCPRCAGMSTRWFVSGIDRNPGVRFYKCPNQGDGRPVRLLVVGGPVRVLHHQRWHQPSHQGGRRWEQRDVWYRTRHGRCTFFWSMKNNQCT